MVTPPSRKQSFSMPQPDLEQFHSNFNYHDPLTFQAKHQSKILNLKLIVAISSISRRYIECMASNSEMLSLSNMNRSCQSQHNGQSTETELLFLLIYLSIIFPTNIYMPLKQSACNPQLRTKVQACPKINRKTQRKLNMQSQKQIISASLMGYTP